MTNTRARQMDGIEAARAEMAAAEAESERENARLAKTNTEIDALTDQVKLTDPDDAKAFERLVATRDAARGRAEALIVRVERASAALKRAREHVAEVERQEIQARLAELDAKLRERDTALSHEVLEFYHALLGRIRELRTLASNANALGAELGAPRGLYGDEGRGTRWAQAPLNKLAWKWAIGVLPDHVAGEEA